MTACIVLVIPNRGKAAREACLPDQRICAWPAETVGVGGDLVFGYSSELKYKISRCARNDILVGDGYPEIPRISIIVIPNPRGAG